jgi:hypothetical protein
MTALGGHLRPIFHLVGSSETRVTLYSQQVRALNTVAELLDSGLPDGSTVAIVGAGAAGITAAAAIAMAAPTVHVDIYEAKDRLLHLQHGSHRFLHPHIYDWPDDGAETADAELPILNWQAGEAHTVAEALEAEFYNVIRVRGVEVHFSNEVTHVELKRDQGFELQVTGTKDNTTHLATADVVLACVGFGYERVPDGKTPSYWGAISLQGALKLPGNNAFIFVSGNGDGGLVDFAMAAFNGLSHIDIAKLVIKADRMDGTKATLLKIEKEAHARGNDNQLDLFGSYREEIVLPNRLLKQVREMLRPACRILFHTRQRYIFSPKSAILNRFIAFLIVRASGPSGKITLLPGKELLGDPVSDDMIRIEGEAPFAPDYRYLRFGPSRIVLGPRKETWPTVCAPFEAMLPAIIPHDSGTPTLSDSAHRWFTRRAASISSPVAPPLHLAPIGRSTVPPSATHTSPLSGLDDHLLAEIVVSGQTGDRRVATGYSVTKDLILTARDVLLGAETVEVGWPFSEEQLGSSRRQGAVVWRGVSEAMDAALIQCEAPSGRFRGTVLVSAPPKRSTAWHTRGLPPQAEMLAGPLLPSSAWGTINVAPAGNSGVDIVYDPACPLSNDQRAICGAPVFCAAGLIGLLALSSCQPSSARPAMIPLWRLLDDEQFCQISGYAVRRALLKELEWKVANLLKTSSASLDALDRARDPAAVGSPYKADDDDHRSILWAGELLGVDYDPFEKIDLLLAARRHLVRTGQLNAARALREVAFWIIPTQLREAIEWMRAQDEDVQKTVSLMPAALTTMAELIMAGYDGRPAMYLVPKITSDAQGRMQWPKGKLEVAPPPPDGRWTTATFEEGVRAHFRLKYAAEMISRGFEAAVIDREVAKQLRANATDPEAPRRHYIDLHSTPYHAEAPIFTDILQKLKTDFRDIVILDFARDDATLSRDTDFLLKVRYLLFPDDQ